MVRRLYAGSLVLLLFSACATMTTVTLKPTDTVRNSTVAEKSVTIHFQERQQPSASSPNLELVVTRRVTREQTFQRRFVEKQALSSGARTLLWLGGAALAGGGYTIYQQGLVVIGRDLMGLGLLIPLGGEIVAGNALVGEQWKPESRTLPPKAAPAANSSVVVSVGPDSWTARTNAEGWLAVDISNLADLAEPGGPLTLSVTLQEDLAQKATFSVPPEVVALYRSPPPREEVPVVESPVECTTTGRGSGYRSKSRLKAAQLKYARCERRLSHFRHLRLAAS